MTRRQKLVEKARNNRPYPVKQMLGVIEKYRLGE